MFPILELAGPKTGWGLGRDGGIYIDATDLYRQIAPPFVRLHDIETPFARDQLFDVHVYTNDTTAGHARYFERSDAYIDSILAASPNAKIIFRLGESIGVADQFNPYAVKPAGTAAPHGWWWWQSLLKRVFSDYAGTWLVQTGLVSLCQKSIFDACFAHL